MRRAKNIGLSIIASLLMASSVVLPVRAEGMRVFNNAHRPYRLLAKQYATAANVFPTADPSPAGTPLTLANAMGQAPSDGVVTVTLQAGFTAPVTVTAFYWQYDKAGTGTACYVRAANIAAAYAASIDTQYATVSFSIPGDTPFVLQSSAAVTGNVYISAPAATSNPGSSATGY